MVRGWRYTELSPTSALLLSFSGMCLALLFLSFCRFCFVLVCISKLSLELCRLSSCIYLFSRPHTELTTAYFTGYG